MGREDELATLMSAWDAARAGTASVVLLGGEAGIGKTALLQRFVAGLPDEALVLRGQCVDGGSRGLAYAPVVGVMSDLVRRLGRETVIRSAGAWRADLARLVPDLGPPSPDGEAGRARLFQAVLSVLQDVAARRPVVVVLEDLHWADESTLELVRHMVRTLGDDPVLMIASLRSDELTRRHPLTSVLADLAMVGRVSQVQLPRLSADQTARLVMMNMDEPLDQSLVSDVVARSEGVPFYAEELARSARSAGRALPVLLAEVLSGKVGELSDDARSVLEIAAVGGAHLVEADLAVVANLADEQVERAIAEGIDRSVLMLTADPAACGFRHALLREALLDGLLPGRRAALHRRWAEHLSTTSTASIDPRRAVLVAQHWLSARQTERAFPACLTAARALQSAAAPDEELHMLEQALSLWDGVPDAARLAGTDRSAVQEAAAQAASQAGQPTRAVAFQTAALTGVDPERQPVRHASIRLERTRLTEPLGQEVTAEVEAVLALLPASEPASEAGRVRARALAMLARGRNLQGDYLEAERLARQAAEYSRGAGERLAEAHAMSLLGNALDGLGRSVEALAVRYERQPLVDTIDNPFVKAGSLRNVAVTLALLGRLRESADAARDGRALATSLGLARSEGASYAAIEAESRIALGEWDVAADLCEQALATGPGPDEAVELATLAATLAVWRGDPTAPELLARAHGCMQRTDDAWHILPFATLRGRAALEVGDARGALSTLSEAMSSPNAVFHPDTAGPFLHTAARALRQGPSPASVEPSVMLVEDVRARLDGLPSGVWADAWRALAFAELVRPDDALATWRACTHELDDGVEGFAYERAYALYRLGLARAGAGRPDAVATLRMAQQKAEHLRARPLLRRIIEAIRECQAGCPRNAEPAAGEAPNNVYGLTEREVEVLGLVGEGLSNSEIASRLFISPKTASVHVSNILAKTGVASRHAAADRARTLGLIGS